MYEQSSGRKLEVHEIAELVRQHDAKAMETFTNFGEHLGKGLESIITQFQPTRIVLGGQIAKSLDLFEEPITRIMKENNIEIPISAAVDENYAIYGAAYYATMKAEVTKTS
jgi:glucokinase